MMMMMINAHPSPSHTQIVGSTQKSMSKMTHVFPLAVPLSTVLLNTSVTVWWWYHCSFVQLTALHYPPVCALVNIDADAYSCAGEVLDDDTSRDDDDAGLMMSTPMYAHSGMHQCVGAVRHLEAVRLQWLCYAMLSENACVGLWVGCFERSPTPGGLLGSTPALMLRGSCCSPAETMGWFVSLYYLFLLPASSMMSKHCSSLWSAASVSVLLCNALLCYTECREKYHRGWRGRRVERDCDLWSRASPTDPPLLPSPEPAPLLAKTVR